MSKYIKVPKLDCPICGCFMLHKRGLKGASDCYVCPVCRSIFLPEIDRKQIHKILHRQ